MIVEVAKTQDDEVGDGTTTAAVLAGEFLRMQRNSWNRSTSNSYRKRIQACLDKGKRNSPGPCKTSNCR